MRTWYLMPSFHSTFRKPESSLKFLLPFMLFWGYVAANLATLTLSAGIRVQ